MKQDVFKYLKAYSTDPIKIDKLIVSTFIQINNLAINNNVLLKQYQISNNTEEYNQVKNFINIILQENNDFNFENLIELFEFVISPEDRIINGAIYTPRYIRNYIIDESIKKFSSNNKHLEISNLKYADISCGCGGFLYDLAKKIKFLTGIEYKDIFKNNIFGLDIQEYSITRTQLLLSLLAISEGEDEIDFQFNLFQGDTLSFDWTKITLNFNGFHIIVGNPPYVRLRNLNDNTKELLKNWEVCKTGLTDLYIPFFQIGVENLSLNGVLGYITMNSFFKSLNGRALREYFEKNKLFIQILDFGGEQIFKSKSTYTCICFIHKIESDAIEFIELKKSEIMQSHKFNRIKYLTLNHHKGWNLRDTDIINKIENMGTPFNKLYNSRHGIATLKNSIYIFKPMYEDKDYYYLQNHQVNKIEKNICRDIINPNKIKVYQDLNILKEKILFPYTNDCKPKILDENFIKESYPFAYKYLQNMKSILAERDKGKGKYENWYAFGRTQSLERIKNKLFFPKISNKSPNCIIEMDENLYYYNGQAIISETEKKLQLIKQIMESNLFWYYITRSSKPYNSNYYSLNGNYINNFGIPDFTDDEINFLISQQDKKLVNQFLEEKYGIIL